MICFLADLDIVVRLILFANLSNSNMAEIDTFAETQKTSTLTDSEDPDEMPHNNACFKLCKPRICSIFYNVFNKSNKT